MWSERERSRDLSSPVIHLLGTKIERRGVIGVQNVRRLGLALKHVGDGFAVKQNVDLGLALEVKEVFLVATDEDPVVFYHRLDFFYAPSSTRPPDAQLKLRTRTCVRPLKNTHPSLRWVAQIHAPAMLRATKIK